MNLKALALALIVVGGVGFGASALMSEAPEATPFRLYTTRGKLFDLSEHKGKVVIIDFFATWCPPCRAAMPELQAIHEAYKDRDVVVVGVQCSDNQSPDQLLLDLGVKYRVLVGGDDVARAYKVTGLPTILVIGRDGKVAFRKSGFNSAMSAQLTHEIDRALGLTN